MIGSVRIVDKKEESKTLGLRYHNWYHSFLSGHVSTGRTPGRGFFSFLSGGEWGLLHEYCTRMLRVLVEMASRET